MPSFVVMSKLSILFVLQKYQYLCKSCSFQIKTTSNVCPYFIQVVRGAVIINIKRSCTNFASRG